MIKTDLEVLQDLCEEKGIYLEPWNEETVLIAFASFSAVLDVPRAFLVAYRINNPKTRK